MISRYPAPDMISGASLNIVSKVARRVELIFVDQLKTNINKLRYFTQEIV